MATDVSEVRSGERAAFGTQQSGRMGRRALIASALGHTFEGPDFLAYGYFATTVTREYFPLHDGVLCLLLAFGMFGSTWLMRPLAAVVLSKYGEHMGVSVATGRRSSI